MNYSNLYILIKGDAHLSPFTTCKTRSSHFPLFSKNTNTLTFIISRTNLNTTLFKHSCRRANKVYIKECVARYASLELINGLVSHTPGWRGGSSCCN